MAVTIKDVALKAGVAPSTVSRVIQNSHSISDATKEKVRKAMKELNYYPNLNARSLVNQKSNVIGLVLPDATDAFYQNPFFPTVLRGINDEAAKTGYALLLATGQTSHKRQSNVEKMVHGRQVDGLIFLYAADDDPIFNLVNKLGFPYVVIGTPASRYVNYVDNDNRLSGYDATNYLIKNGAKKIAFIGGPDNLIFVKDRQEGYQRALREAGIKAEADWVFNNMPFVPEEGFKHAEYVQKLDDVDAVVVADQLVAKGFKAGWRQLGQPMIPVMTFKAYDSSDMLMSQADAFIDIQAQQLGQVAFQMILQVLSDEQSKPVRFAHEFILHVLVEK